MASEEGSQGQPAKNEGRNEHETTCAMAGEIGSQGPPAKKEERKEYMARKETLWTREVLALVSTVSACVLIFVPVWYKTTEVYRSPLPYAGIQNFSTQPVCQWFAGFASVSNQYVNGLLALQVFLRVPFLM